METLTFRPLTHDDLALVQRWLDAPHARLWLGGGATLDELTVEYGPVIAGEVPQRAHVALLAGRPVGLFEHERFGDTPDFQRLYEVDDPDAANCDVLVGEPELAHRGLGPEMIRAFLARVVFADPRITACVIDPVPDNAIAIRAYEKVGFRFVRALPDDGEGNGLYLMELRRDELHRPAAPEGFYLRPAREEEVAVARAIDDDACTLYPEAGIVLTPEVIAVLDPREIQQWREAARRGRLLFACAPDGEPVGFVALGIVDGKPYVEQVSVRRAWMRRGVGRALLTRAMRWSVRDGELWLATWRHVAWNGPFYARLGFVEVPEARWGPAQKDIVDFERRVLPAPEARVVMRYTHRPTREERHPGNADNTSVTQVPGPVAPSSGSRGDVRALRR